MTRNDDKKSFVLYTEYKDHLTNLSFDEKGKIFDAIFEYFDTEKIPEYIASDRLLNMAFSFIKSQLDRDNEKYQKKIEARREAGSRGGLAKASNVKQNVAKASNTKKSVANVADDDNDNVNEYDNVDVDANENDNENVNDINTLPDDKSLAHDIEIIDNDDNINTDLIKPLAKSKSGTITRRSDTIAGRGEKTGGALIFEAYAEAYRGRYKTDPIRNAKTNAQAKKISESIPLDEAIAVARFYLGHNDSYYVRRSHDFGDLLVNLQGLRTQMMTGDKITSKRARSIESTSENLSQYERLMKKMGLTEE